MHSGSINVKRPEDSKISNDTLNKIQRLNSWEEEEEEEEEEEWKTCIIRRKDIYQQQISTMFSYVFYKKGIDTAGLTQSNF